MTDKVLIIGDVHLSDKPPASCTESYTEDLFDLLYDCYRVADMYNVDAIVQAGDFFHIKRADRNSHKLVKRALSWANDSLWPIGVVPGNHDMSMDRLASVYETQPLGVLAQAGAISILDEWAVDRSAIFDSLPIYGVPWLQEWDDSSVAKALAEYSKAGAPGLIVTHAPLFPPGSEPPYEFYDVRKFAEYVGEGSVYYGHIHEKHGTYTVGDVEFCNNGALSRGSLTEYNVNREVGVTIWTQGTFEFVPLNYKPASEVFLMDEVREKKQVTADLNEFLDSVGRTSLEINSVEDVISELKEQDLDKDTLSMLDSLLRDAWEVK